ncbi:hypothetical protein [Streptomyces sp. NPDC094049]|uniref:hypothetical protein n=1 Tax=Streptomyces sp. NPDC094049 TaxID=3154987 RepID=UPI00332BA74F
MPDLPHDRKHSEHDRWKALEVRRPEQVRTSTGGPVPLGFDDEPLASGTVVLDEGEVVQLVEAHREGAAVKALARQYGPARCPTTCPRSSTRTRTASTARSRGPPIRS